MKTTHVMTFSAAALLASEAAWAQTGHMMNGGFWDGGWMVGYGGIWMPILLVVAVVAIVVLIIKRK